MVGRSGQRFANQVDRGDTDRALRFGLAFEMGHPAAFLFVAGLGGVGLAAMAAAYARQQMAHLATAWRTVAKLQVVLAVPLVAFCVPHADAIMGVLYGSS